MNKTRIDHTQRSTILRLLRTTDLTITAIAVRVGCSDFPVKQLNRAHKIRPLIRGGSVNAYLRLGNLA